MMKLQGVAYLIVSISLFLVPACTMPETASETVTQLPDRIPVGSALELPGTKWRLVEFQSMDDAQGIKRPANPDSYTVEFGSDGRAALRLDCNRGTGGYTSEVTGGSGGSLTFGLMAVTKAMCSPPSMGELLERQLAYVRSYTIADGNLHMALMADGGIFVWEPVPDDG